MSAPVHTYWMHRHPRDPRGPVANLDLNYTWSHPGAGFSPMLDQVNRHLDHLDRPELPSGATMRPRAPTSWGWWFWPERPGPGVYLSFFTGKALQMTWVALWVTHGLNSSSGAGSVGHLEIPATQVAAIHPGLGPCKSTVDTTGAIRVVVSRRLWLHHPHRPHPHLDGWSFL